MLFAIDEKVKVTVRWRLANAPAARLQNQHSTQTKQRQAHLLFLLCRLVDRLVGARRWLLKTHAIEHKIERTADEPVAAVEHELDARMALIDCAELARHTLALSMSVDLDVAQTSNHLALVDESHVLGRLAARLLLVVDGENDWFLCSRKRR